MWVPAENRRFVLGDLPVLLMGGAPVHEELPELHAPGGRVPACAGWSVVPKATLCVVDGPGDSGCVVPGAFSPEEFGHVVEWCETVERAGGAVVVSVGALPGEAESVDWDALLSGGSRGGFVPALTAP
ncbi:hypothetical protein [Streptomyces roseolilacinus]|uniref:Uncharacterized protein n=1 Tax=Streptomyces roseolilacinus TaxID=66904 RepID=A0A918B183_9ACTN|nr:hypothetical protein [Streptomyces roseolilacinus]GGQ12632.1 hypothetical protein GCM10010249_34090 [Streptomyces roseolilacinus]